MISDIFKIQKQSLFELTSMFQLAFVMKHNYERELLAFLKLFKRQELLGFSYEKKEGKWSLFLHFPNGVIQISGNKEFSLKDVVYASVILETVL